MNSESIKNSFNDCPNSKLEIKANNYNKTKTFNVQESVDKHLSRVDSQNDPDVTENLDNIARKMGINQSNNNSRPTMKVKLNKSDRCSEEKLNEKDISKSFQVPNYDNCASVDCILDYAKQKKLMKHRESNSSTSEDLIDQEAKLNAGMNPLSNDVISDEFPDLKNKKASAEIQQML